MSGRTVTTWIAIVPLDLCPAGFARDELVRRMKERFPGYAFKLQASGPYGDDVQAIPICSAAHPSDPNAMLMLPQPPVDHVEEVGGALWEIASSMVFALN